MTKSSPDVTKPENRARTAVPRARPALRTSAQTSVQTSAQTSVRATARSEQSLTSPRRPIRQFVLTQPGECPYLDGQVEQKLVTALDPADPEAYGALHRAGFRRSHEMAYRPACPTCDKCKSLRIDVNAFQANRTQGKLLRRHSGLKRSIAELGPTQTSFELFSHYTSTRHADSEMASMGWRDYQALVLESGVDTHLIEWHDPDHEAGPKLVAACVIDVLADGLSMVYSFFDTSRPADSLGNFMVLSLMEVCRTLQLPYLYLGYWVKGSATMDYKAQYRAAEIFGPLGWQEMDKPDKRTS